MLRRVLAVGAPILLFLVLYWPGLTIYFYQDDFAWLNVRHEVHSWRDVPAALFVPKAHGNLRPWSETGFFLLLGTLFGANPLPFRICVFLTACADLLLLGAVVRRLTASAAAAFWTEVLWIANSCVAVAACWTSIFNQFQYLLFVLGAFYLFLRGRYGWSWVVFVLGLGSLEVMVMFPALATLYALLFKRELVKKALPMFAASAAYAAVHFLAAPAVSQGPYALHFDGAIPRTLWAYCSLALGPERLAHFGFISSGIAALLTALLCVAVIAMARDRVIWFGIGWFLILLAPLLPLRDHISDYYLTGPIIGLALVEAWMVTRARWASVVVGALFLAMMIPAARATALWHHARAEAVEDLVLGVEQVRARHPGKAILLTGVGTDVFLAGIDAAPFIALEIPSVYLAPGSEAKIDAPERVSWYELPEGMARRALDEDRAVVYDASGAMLRNVTAMYRGVWRPGQPGFVNVGDPIFAAQLSGEWGPAEYGARHMGNRASVRVAAGRELSVGLYCEAAPLSLRVAVSGVEKRETFARCDSLHIVTMALSGAEGEIEVQLQAQPPGKVRFGFVSAR